VKRSLENSIWRWLGISKDLRVNERIRAHKVRLIAQDGNQIGIVELREALEEAAQQQLDLVEVAPQANPPVCRIMDYGKYKYEQAKREKEARRNARTVTVKEVKLRPKIDDHDFDVKLKHARRFLDNGDKVKVTIMFRGREIVHPELGREILDRITDGVSDIGEVESKPNMEGRNMVMMLGPRTD
jgi:translation initiation factor IF-3